MKIVTGLFSPDDVVAAVRRLTNNGFSYDDLSLMSSASEMPDFLTGEPEESAVTGATVGATAGAATGALGAVAASTIPGFESMFVSGLMATAVGGVIGGYLGSLYSVRAETQTELNVHEALESGQILLVIRVSETEVQTAATLLEQSDGEQVEIHAIPAEEEAVN